MTLDAELADALHRAVSDGIPGETVRVVDAVVAADGHDAVALVLLNADTPDPAPMISFCQRDDDGWDELVMTDAGDAGTNWLGHRWVAYASGSAPPGATTVIAEHAGTSDRRPVADGGLYVVAVFGPAGGDESELVHPPLVTFDERC